MMFIEMTHPHSVGKPIYRLNNLYERLDRWIVGRSANSCKRCIRP